MKFLTKLLAGGGVAAFFFFSWVIMRLWNHILAWRLQLVPPLTYLQAAGLWFLLIILFAWTGIAAARGVTLFRKHRDWDDLGGRIESKLKQRLSHWAGTRSHHESWDDIADRIEQRVKRGLARWLDADESVAWEDLGERIEDKIRHKFEDTEPED